MTRCGPTFLARCWHRCRLRFRTPLPTRGEGAQRQLPCSGGPFQAVSWRAVGAAAKRMSEPTIGASYEATLHEAPRQPSPIVGANTLNAGASTTSRESSADRLVLKASIPIFPFACLWLGARKQRERVWEPASLRARRGNLRATWCSSRSISLRVSIMSARRTKAQNGNVFVRHRVRGVCGVEGAEPG